MDSNGVFGLHFHGSHGMDVMASIECHGRGGILQNSTEAMELDLVEN